MLFLTRQGTLILTGKNSTIMICPAINMESFLNSIVLMTRYLNSLTCYLSSTTCYLISLTRQIKH